MSYSTGAELHTRSKSHKEGTSVEEVLSKIYLVKASGGSAYLSIPKCMIGKRVKIVLEGK